MRWGIAGYGDIVRRRGLPALQSLSETVTCVWGRDAARARRFCDEHGVPHATSTFSTLLELVDAVYVATPVAAHAPLVAAAVRAGRHVLVEKPLCGSLAAAVPAPVLRSGDIRVGVAYYRRLAPACRRLRELIRGRTIHRAAVAFGGFFDPAPTDPKHWRTDPSVAGGGVLADVGSHRLDLLCWLLGQPVSVTATVGASFPSGAERTARVNLTWPSGTAACLSLDWTCEQPHDRLRLELSGGHLELDPLDSGRVTGVLDGKVIDEDLAPPDNPHVPLVADFVGSVRYGGVPVCPVEEALTVDGLIAAAYRAAATQTARRRHE